MAACLASSHGAWGGYIKKSAISVIMRKKKKARILPCDFICSADVSFWRCCKRNSGGARLLLK